MDDKAEEQSRCMLLYMFSQSNQSTQSQENAPMKTVLEDRECMINEGTKRWERKQSEKQGRRAIKMRVIQNGGPKEDIILVIFLEAHHQDYQNIGNTDRDRHARR